MEAVAMLARIAAAVEPTRRRVPVKERYANQDATRRVRPEHLVPISVEASLEYLEPAAIFVPSVSGTTARRMASLHFPAPLVAISAREKTCQDMKFSYGVIPICDAATPSAQYARDWVRSHGLSGEFAILTQRVPPEDPTGDHRMEIIIL